MTKRPWPPEPRKLYLRDGVGPSSIIFFMLGGFSLVTQATHGHYLLTFFWAAYIGFVAFIVYALARLEQQKRIFEITQTLRAAAALKHKNDVRSVD